ncbi:MAG: protein kinase domain-containing protein [Ktedonobacteraceae bacterium]
MNAEALIGTVLGTSTLQQLIGQGGMGAVYLAQQSRPRRQVAVKVLMPATSLKPQQLSAFLERFRRETDAAASLEHPNIMPVYEYGERGGLAFLVMPYISAGTLRDVMEREVQIAFTDAVRYLEQMAAALDFAHARGVIHRDIKPANMLLTPDGRLLLTDFGLVKIISEQQSEQLRLTGAGAPVGTPDYMSPEQVIGGEVDGRADQYSLGVVLFHMLTGATPFQGETPMQIASQQLHMQPPAPRLLRQDLPEAAEQVILRALSKRPEQRFNSTQEFSSAFRAALVEQPRQNTPGASQSANLRKGSLFDPKWQNTGTMPTFGASHLNQSMPVTPTASFVAQAEPSTTRPTGTGLLSKTGFFPQVGLNENTGALPSATASPVNPNASFFSTDHMQTANPMQQAPFGQTGTGTLSFATEPTGVQQSLFAQPNTMTQQTFPTGNLQQYSPTAQSTTMALSLLRTEPTSGGHTIKLTGPVKVVQVPIAPGQYVTGLLPIQKESADPVSEPAVKRASTLQKILLVVAALVLLVGAVGGGVVLIRSHTNATPNSNTTSTKSNATSPTTLATATATANIVFSDQLNQNIHGWPIGSVNGNTYSFQNGTYHISNQTLDKSALVVTPESFKQTALTYQITMQEVAGDDSDTTNTFGIALRSNLQTVNGQQTGACYVFEIRNNNNNSIYAFYKYDSSQKNPWGNPIGKFTKPGQEFHGGHNQNASNTVKIVAVGGSFTFYVNGQQVGTVQDNSLTSGSVGMVVNLKGTEVAFSNLLITLN